MGLSNILFSAAAATSILLATTVAAPVKEKGLVAAVTLRDFDTDSYIPFAAIPCQDSTDTSATACMRYNVEYTNDINVCTTLAVRAETALAYDRFAPLYFNCASDDNGGTLIEFKPIDEATAHCSKQVRDEDSMSGALGPLCLGGRTDDEKFISQKRELESSSPSSLDLAKRQFGHPPAKIEENTQSCIAVNNGLYNNYYIQIGVKLNMERCHLLGHDMDYHSSTFRDYWCGDDGFGDTRISFVETINGAGGLNNDLHYYFPTVNGFNCPNYRIKSEAENDLTVGDAEKQLEKRKHTKLEPVQYARRQAHQQPAGSQSCHATNNGLYNTYKIQIGSPYRAETCRAAGAALDADSVGLNSFYCVADDFGDTYVSFDDTINRGGDINQILHRYWPSINGFNCPDYRVQSEAFDVGTNQTELARKPKHQLADNTQSCTATNHGLYNTYHVQIGWFFGYETCKDAGAALDKASAGLNDYYCGDDGFGGIYMTFEDTINRGGKINKTLGAQWPTVNGFNCPDK